MPRDTSDGPSSGSGRPPREAIVEPGGRVGELADLDAVLDRLAEQVAAAGVVADRLGVAEPPPIDLETELVAALARPIGTPPLRDLARGVRTVAIITSDATRAVPTARLLDPVVATLVEAGVSPDGIDLVVGTGAHRGAGADEIAAMLGRRWSGVLRAGNHDARAADLVAVGRLPDGTPLRLDRRVARADLRIAFGQVEPHEFAGFTGGRKAILPAVADYDAVIHNHALQRLAAPGARSGVLQGNPIHEEMVAAARLGRLDFIVNVVLDRRLRPLAVTAGDTEAAHEALASFVRGYAAPPAFAAAAPDVIVTGPGDPLDINLYQSVKALVGIEPLLGARAAADSPRRPVVLLLSRCWDGTGSEEMLEPFRATALAESGIAGERPARRPTAAGERPAGHASAAHRADLERHAARAAARARAVLAELEHSYTIEKDHSYYLARVGLRGAPIVACCPGVAATDLAVLGWCAVPDPAEALRLALASVVRDTGPGAGESGRVLFVARPQRLLLGHGDGQTHATSDHRRTR